MLLMDAAMMGFQLDLPTYSGEHAGERSLTSAVQDLADAVTALEEHGVTPRRVVLLGGAARSRAVQLIAASTFGLPVHVPPPGEYVALGAARQAAWTLLGTETPPEWPVAATELADPGEGPDATDLRAAYADLRERTAAWSPRS